MPNPKGKCVYHLVISEKNKKMFDRLYPGLLKIFLEKSIKLATEKKDFFEEVFFSNVDIGV